MINSQSHRSHDQVPSALDVASKLLAYCRANDWAGYDPYDALNSGLFNSLPLSDIRLFRLMFTQALKRSPVNLRPLLRVEATQNPKGLALFLTAVLKLRKLAILRDDRLARELIARIIALRSTGTKYWAWGYSFPWQTRTVLVPRGAPNLVCTTFVAGALLDAYDEFGDTELLEAATSAATYISDELYYTSGDSVASFSYPLPASKSKVHNANFLAAALLCRVYRYTENDKLLRPALQVARYSVGRQKDDGSWSYGELPNQNWIDNFHTGYNLSALRAIDRYLGTSEFEPYARRGFAFYRDHFFCENGAVRYFHNGTYPIDIHCVAQSILTLLEFRHLDSTNLRTLDLVYDWTISNMWDKTGFFYYRMLRIVKIRTPYMRWSQAWMLLALSVFLEKLGSVETPAPVKLESKVMAVTE